MEVPKSHFMGSIVNMPTRSVPKGVAKFLLIDGQQRLTTNFILLTLLRDYTRSIRENEFVEEINNTLIVNTHKKYNKYFKLLPTQVDRAIFENMLRGKIDKNFENKIIKKYFF